MGSYRFEFSILKPFSVEVKLFSFLLHLNIFISSQFDCSVSWTVVQKSVNKRKTISNRIRNEVSLILDLDSSHSIGRFNASMMELYDIVEMFPFEIVVISPFRLVTFPGRFRSVLLQDGPSTSNRPIKGWKSNTHIGLVNGYLDFSVSQCRNASRANITRSDDEVLLIDEDVVMK